MPAENGSGWEDVLKRHLGRKGSAGAAKPVRLSDLAPPAEPGPADPLPAGPSATPRVPVRPPGPAPQQAAPVGSRPRPDNDDGDAVERLRAELRESEAARRRAEERVAGLEREIASLRTGAPGGAAGTDGDHAEIERLRREIEEAHTVIRAIEEAYLAGGGDGGPGTVPPVL